MMKRVFSLLLCLIMVLGLVPTTVQATTDVETSTDIMDNIVFDGDISGNVVIDGNTVTNTEDNKLTYPSDLVNNETLGVPYACDCADLATAVDHVGICAAKLSYMKQCEASEQELFALWGSYTLEEQSFMLEHLEDTYPLKYMELVKLLNAPTGSASETLNDGTTVSVQGIPQDGSLTVTEAPENAQSIVDRYVNAGSSAAVELFSYDVSVQDGKGADWQPDVQVKMELELPDVKLHKYTRVYIVHVDDEGNATTIEATVTEDGKIVFETPGFSTFAGFTVDFHFENVTFSIPGMSSITLSELFENMKLPVFAEDVVNVEYTDYTQLKVEKLEGDWRLTSLKAFTTEEKLTLTMADGSVYHIDVTDATGDDKIDVMANLYTATESDVAGYWIEGPNASNPNGFLTLYMQSDGSVTSNDKNGEMCDNAYLIVDGRGVGGCLEIILQEPDNNTAKNNTVRWDLWTLKIIGGANVVIRLGGSFEGGETIEITRYKSRAVFDIQNGSLYFNLGSQDKSLASGLDADMTITSATNAKIVINGSTLANEKQDALIYCGYDAKKLIMNNVIFQNGNFRGIFVLAANMEILQLRNCEFQSTVKYDNGGGGAIRINKTTVNTDYYKPEKRNATVYVKKFYCYDVIFNGNTAGMGTDKTGHGGAILADGNLDDTKFISCNFNACKTRGHGAAVCIGSAQESFNMNDFEFTNCDFVNCEATSGYGGAFAITDKFAHLTFDDCDFNNNTASTHAGAINITYGDSGVQGGYITVKNSRFSGNTATGNRGGAIRMTLKPYVKSDDTLLAPQVTIQDSSFDTHSAGSLGGTVAISGINTFSVKINDTTTKTYTGDIGSISVSGCTFKNSTAEHYGGALVITDASYSSVSITNSTFENCSSTRYGGGICLRTQSATKPLVVKGDISIIGCSFRNCHAGYLGSDPDYRNGTIPKTWDHDNNPLTPEIEMINGLAGGGGIVVGCEVGGKVEIKGASAENPMQFINCTSWNNGGAIVFPTAMEDAPVPEYPLVEMQYLNIDRCFARDAGFAMYLAQINIHEFTMTDSIIQNCGYFDVSDPNFPRSQVFPADSAVLPAKWVDLNGAEDLIDNATYDNSRLKMWRYYSQDALCRSQDTGGTFRTIGNSFIIATIDNCVFRNNRSFAGGAGVYWNSLQIRQVDGVDKLPSLTLKNTLFDSNVAQSHGGGIYCESTVNIQSCEFKSNVAYGIGGAIAQKTYNNEFRPMNDYETNEIILGSVTPVEGAAAVPTKIHHNKATNGGGIAINVSVSDSVKEENPVRYPTKFALGGTHVYENTATENGGGIYYATTTYDNKADQEEVDYFTKEINLNDGLIWGNVSGAAADQVADNYTPTVGDHLIIAALDNNVAMGTDEDGNIGAEGFVNKHTTTTATDNLVFSSEALVLTWRPGNQSGTYAFQMYGDNYLAGDNNSSGKGTNVHADDFQFGIVKYTNATNAWTVTLGTDGAAKIQLKCNASKDTTLRSYMRYNHNTSDGTGWFNIYTYENAYGTNGKANCTDIYIYKVVSENNNQGVATLVTDINDLSSGDRFIFVAWNPDYGQYATMKPSNFATRRTTFLQHQAANYVTYGTDTEVYTLENGSAADTYRLKIANNSYLGGSPTDAQLRAVASNGLNQWYMTFGSTGRAKLTLKVTTSDVTKQETDGLRKHLCYFVNENAGKENEKWFNNYADSTSVMHNRRNISVYRVTSETNRTAELVTKSSMLKVGDKLIIVAMEQEFSVALSPNKADSDSYRFPANITKYDNYMNFGTGVESTKMADTDVVYGPNTQIITLENVSGKVGFALNVGTNQYLDPVLPAGSTGNLVNNAELGTTDNKMTWTIRIEPFNGEAAIVAQNGGKRNIMRYNLSGWFNIYTENHKQEAICVYRVTSEANRTAELVTKDTTLMAGDKIIIAAKDYNWVMSTEQHNTVRKLETVSKTVINHTVKPQVLNVVAGGNHTYGLQIEDGKYLAVDADGLKTVETYDESTCGWTLSVSGGKLTAQANGKTLRYDAANHEFGAFSNASAVGDVVLYKMGVETGGGSGGGVYMDSNQVNTNNGGSSTLNISGASIYQNVAYVGNGGGIYLTGQNALCSIDGTATYVGPQSGETDQYGNKAYGVSVGNSQYVGGNGGGIAIFGSARIEMSGGYVLDNMATTAGGGIAVHNKSSMYFTDGTVAGNISHMGGGISLNDSQAVNTNPTASTPDKDRYGMFLDGGNIVNNKVTPNAEGKAYGGGICISQSTMKIDGGLISGNTAAGDLDATTYAPDQEGGGIAVCQGANMVIAGGTIRGNKASLGGGVVVRGSSTLDMTGIVTEDDEYNITSHDGSIIENYANNQGGGIMIHKGSSGAKNYVTMTGGYIANNTCRNQGGGVYVSQYCAFTLDGGHVDWNEANEGGAIATWAGEVHIKNGVMMGNSANENGGAILAEYTQMDVTGGRFIKNHAASYGGAILVYCSQLNYYLEQYRMKLNVAGGVFDSNTSGNSGGAIYGQQAYITIGLDTNGDGVVDAEEAKGTGAEFINNKCDGEATENVNGGAMCLEGCVADISKGAFTNNTAKHNGGAIAVNHFDYQVEVEKTIDGVKQKVLEDRVQHSTLTISGGVFNDNRSSGNGGGIWISAGQTSSDGNTTSLTMTGGEITENTAAGNGGGIWSGDCAQVNIMGTTSVHGEISNNTANNGGGVYVTSGADLVVHNGHITNNNAVATETPNLTTAYGNDSNLAGVGGGICVTAGTSGANSTFTLTGSENAGGRMDVAIFGNSATFAADDVFASGNNTKLSVPTIDQMNLAGYGFRPEAWTEDYATGDTSYVDHGTRMLTNTLISELGISRYRNATPTARKNMVISASVVNNAVNTANKYVCMTLGIPGATEDTILVDYDATVDIEIWQNDLFMETTNYAAGHVYIGLTFPEGALHKDGISCSEGALPLANIIKDQSGKDVYDRYAENLATKIGSVRNNNNGALTFNVYTTEFSETCEFYYTVERAGFWYYASVNVIPATSIYYDDTSVAITYHDTSAYEDLASWTTEGVASNVHQSHVRPSSDLFGVLDANQIYGFDSNFSDTTSFSGGIAHKVTASRHYGVDSNGDNECDVCGVAIQLTHEYVSKNSKGQCKTCLNTAENHGSDVPAHECREYTTYNEYCDFCGKWIGTHTTNARATFTFTGTGFDVVGLSSAATGIVMVTVYKGTVTDFDNPPWDDYVASFMVDTFYGYAYDEDLGKWVPTEDSDEIFYQVPVIKADMEKILVGYDSNDNPIYDSYGYGTYSVEIYIAPSYLEREHGYWNTDFYLDGIRVYNPAGIGGSENEDAYDAYVADGENWPVYAELRNMFITQNELGVDTTNGIIFIDGRTEATLAEYKSWGPNNEVYLNPGESVAFTLNASNYAMSVGGGDLDSNIVAGVQLGMRGLTGLGKVTIYQNQSKFKTIDMGTTDMYYDITDLMNKVVTITNEGNTAISLSNVKITHKYAPVVTGEMGTMFTMNEMDANLALNVFTPEMLADPVLKPKYPALSFEGMVSYNVFFTAEELGDLNGADLGLAVFGSYEPDGTVETAKDVIMGATQIDGLYMVATNGVHAKSLGETQYFRAFAKKADGSYVYSKMVSYSALDYAKNTLAKSNDVKLKQLVVAMLNYGAEAQKFFGYNTEDLMNEDLTAEQQALVSGIDGSTLNPVGKVDASKVGSFASNGGFAKKYPAISFKGAFEINYFMAPSYAVDNGMRLYVWNEDTYNSATELTANNADKVVTMTLENGLYTASSDQIAAKDLDKTVYVAAVYESNGVSYCSGVLPYSIAAYCQKPAADVAALANAAAVYGAAAKEFFGA